MSSPRACGTRVAGGAYLEIPLSRTGRPLSDFIFCPPREIDLKANGITAVGTKLIQGSDGIWHVFDLIGEEHYPNVADYLEETARLGVSRRIAKTTDFSKLERGSCLFVVHRKAWIQNWEEARDHEPFFDNLGKWPVCPTGTHSNQDRLMCGRLWWRDVEGGETGLRKMATFSYAGVESPIPLQYSPAIFAGFPITRIAVIRDAAASYVNTANRARSAKGIPVEIEDD